MKKLLLAGLALACVSALAPASAALLSSSTMSLTIDGTTYNPIDSIDGINNGSFAVETANLNTAFGSSFVYLDKSDDVSSSGIGGITFTVTAPSVNNGTWTVAWTDTNLALLPNLPISIDFAVGLFGGNGSNANGAGFLFSNVLLPISPNTGSGAFDINFLNPGGNQPNLSHLTLTGGNVHAPTVGVPEPLTLSLLGSGLIGLGCVRYRRQTV
jgi:PEP-CTERM motif